MNRSKVVFILKFAKQNLVKSPLRSFLMLLSFTFLMVVLTLAFTMNDVLTDYYIYRYERQSEHIDLEMTIGSNASARYFSTRTLDDNYSGDYAKVFKVDVLAEDASYITVFATSEVDFGLLYGTNYTLNDHEIILTETSAKAHHVGVSESLTLSLGTTQKTFVVKAIVPDYGVFQGDKGFILHDPHVALFIQAMFPSLANLPTSFFIHLNNTVYFDTDDVSQTIDTVSTIDAYQTLDYKVSIPIPYIKQLINRAVALFQMMLLFIGITVVLLIQTTYALVFREKEQMLSIIKLLGGSLWFGSFIWLVELLILYLPAALLSYGLAYGIIQVGMELLMPGLAYHLSILPILYSLGILTIIFMVTVLYHVMLWQSKTEVSRLKVMPDRKLSTWIHLSLVGLSLLTYALLSETLWMTIVKLLLVITMTYSLVILVHRGWLFCTKYLKETPYPYLLKISYHKRTLYRFLWLSLATLVTVMLLFETTGYIKHKATVIRNEYQADLVMSNVLTNTQQIQLEVLAHDAVTSAIPIGIYRNVNIDAGNQVFQAVYMLDPIEIPNYFGMTHNQDLQTFQDATEPAIWLPMRYHVVYGINIHDQVTLNLNAAHPNLNFKVLGFFDEAVGNTAFINLHRVSGYEDIKQTHILINTDDPTSVKADLIDQYSAKLYYVNDFQQSAIALSKEVILSMNYATYVTFIILAGLLVSMMNQGLILFGELKPSYVRASVLGLSEGMLKKHLWLEGVILILTLSLSTIGTVLLLNPLIKPLLMLFDEYENIVFNPIDIFIGWLMGILMLLVTRLAYIRGIRHLKPSDVLKMHQID